MTSPLHGEGRRFESGRAHHLFFDSEAGIVSDDSEKKLPTANELPTSAEDSEDNGEGKPETVIVDYGGGIVVHRRLPDGTLDEGHEFSTEELIPNEDDGLAHLDESVQIAWKKAEALKSIDLDTIIAVQDILEADKKPIFIDVGDAEPRASAASSEFILHFSQSELSNFVASRKKGLAPNSMDWINRSSLALWESTRGDISQRTLTLLRETTLDKYASRDSHAKVLSFAVSFLKFQAKTKMEPRYTSFVVYLEMPKAVRERKSITRRIVTKADIENVLTHIKQAGDRGDISSERASQYSAFVIFGAYTGQRSMATMAKLAVVQFKEALQREKPVLQVETSQDKIRMEHYVPLHPQVVAAVQPLLDDRKNEESVFAYGSFLMWVKRQKILMSQFNGRFLLAFGQFP
jgi:integrase